MGLEDSDSDSGWSDESEEDWQPVGLGVALESSDGLELPDLEPEGSEASRSSLTPSGEFLFKDDTVARQMGNWDFIDVMEGGPRSYSMPDVQYVLDTVSTCDLVMGDVAARTLCCIPTSQQLLLDEKGADDLPNTEGQEKKGSKKAASVTCDASFGGVVNSDISIEELDHAY